MSQRLRSQSHVLLYLNLLLCRATFFKLHSHFVLRSIHPFLATNPELYRSGSRLIRIFQISLFPAPSGGSFGVPRPDEIHSLSSMFWVNPGVSYQLCVPRKLSVEGVLEGSWWLNHSILLFLIGEAATLLWAPSKCPKPHILSVELSQAMLQTILISATCLHGLIPLVTA